jgi:hypothetical protein
LQAAESFEGTRRGFVFKKVRVERWSNAGQTLVKRWSNAGRTLVKRWSNAGRTLVERWSNAGQTLVRVKRRVRREAKWRCGFGADLSDFTVLVKHTGQILVKHTGKQKNRRLGGGGVGISDGSIRLAGD